MLALLLTAAAAQAACPATFPQVMGQLDAALTAYDRGLYQEFLLQHAALSEDLPCLQALLEPGEVRQVFLVQLLEAWGRDDLETTSAAMHALLDLEPGFTIATEVKLSDIPLQEFLAQAEASHTPPGPGLPLPLVMWSVWRVNGVKTINGAVPVGRPVVLQLLDEREGKVLTWMLPQGGLPPGFESEEAASGFDWGRIDVSRVVPERKSREPLQVQRLLGAGAGVAGVAAVAGLGVGTWFYRQYGQCRDGAATCSGDDVNGWIDWNDRLVKGGYVAGGVAAALGVGAVVTWRF